jgi:hypothetical protein
MRNYVVRKGMNVGEVSCFARPWHYMTVGWMAVQPRDQAVLLADSRCAGGRCVMVKRENLIPDPNRSHFVYSIT